MTPPWSLKQVVDLVTPALGSSHVSPHGSVFPKGHFQHLVGFNIFGEAVLDRLFGNFFRERSKQSIPYDECGTVISIQVTYI